MKKSELIKIIKEELQKQMSLKEYSGTARVTNAPGRRHEQNDRMMIGLLQECSALLKQIAQNTSKAAPAPTNMSGGE